MNTVKTIFLAGALLIYTSPTSAYQWEDSLSGYITRCFQVRQVKAICDDLSEPERGIKVRAELNIDATDLNGSKFSYGYLKGIEGPLCVRHLRKIKALLKNTNQACITGWGESVTQNGDTIVHWQSIETRRGTVSW